MISIRKIVVQSESPELSRRSRVKSYCKGISGRRDWVKCVTTKFAQRWSVDILTIVQLHIVIGAP